VLEVGVNQVSLLGAKGSAVITKRQLATQTTATDDLQRNVLMQQRVQRDEYLAQNATQAGSTWDAAAEAVSSTLGRGKSQERAKKALTPASPPKPGTPDSLATFALAQYVEFPSRDGFEISVDMTVEFEFTPQHIASIFRDFGDMPAVVDKIILPQILSVSRLKGSAYRAKDFIAGEGREKFQNDLTESLALALHDKRIGINNALIRHVQVPMQILEPIQQRSLAVEQDFTNREMQNTARRLAELNTQLGLIEQRRQQTARETEKIRAEVKAEQEKEVARLRAEALKRTSEIARDTAELRAGRTKILGQAEASVVTLVEGEKARGHLLKTQAFKDPNAYVLWDFAGRLNDTLAVTILHAGPGTLWTDLANPRLADLNAAAHLQAPAKTTLPVRNKTDAP
jgi:regulator of protease activity HflC (stomatin/prohibitin superfamily)